MHIQHVLGSQVRIELPDGFKKSEDFQCSPTPAPTSTISDIDTAVAFANIVLDLVGDVGNHLHGLPEVSPVPLLRITAL